jgi:hypothetical protein
MSYQTQPTMYLFSLEREMMYLFLHMWFCTHKISFVVLALLVCRLLHKATSQKNMKHCHFRVTKLYFFRLVTKFDFQKLMKCHQVIFLHIIWGMLLKLIYGQGAIRYKIQYMHSVAYLLYYEVMSNCIIASIAYMLYYRLIRYCCFLMQNMLFFLSVCIFSYGSYPLFHNTYNYHIWYKFYI